MLHFGFKNDPDVPETLQLLEGRGIPRPKMDTSNFRSRVTVIPTLGADIEMWRGKLIACMHRNASAADFLNPMSNRIVASGTKGDI